MTSNKDLARKLRYAKAMKRNRRIPYFLRQFSDARKQRYNTKQHQWWRNHLKLWFKYFLRVYMATDVNTAPVESWDPGRDQ